MPIRMETEAYAAMLYGMLSCRCPVTEATEKALFAEFFTWPAGGGMDFAPVREIIDHNPDRTPMHNLLEIASYGQEDPENFTICTGDALRALGSKFHFNKLINAVDPMTVKDPPAFLVSHMLVPARLYRVEDQVRAVFEFQQRRITFEHVFLPPAIDREDRRFYAVHMGTVVRSLTDVQAQNLIKHLALIPEFAFFCAQVTTVDFTDFQYYGNYFDQVRSRFERHFPGNS